MPVVPARAADVEPSAKQAIGNSFGLHRCSSEQPIVPQESCVPSKPLIVAAAVAAAASAAVAQQNEVTEGNAQANAGANADGRWVPPGTPGSPIDGTLFHAQVLMSAHGFSPGVIDGKKGESFRLALRSFQESR